jgi:hypothetical protein
MKTLIRLLLILLGVCLAVFISYLLWLILRTHWPIILLCTFIVFGITIAVADYILGAKQLRGTAQGTVLGAYAQAQQSQLQRIIAPVLIYISIATGGWLHNFARGVSAIIIKKSPQSFIRVAIDQNLRGLLMKFAIISSCLIISCYVIMFIGPRAAYLSHFFFIIILTNVISRLSLYTIASPPLPARLRRSSLIRFCHL